MNLKTYVRTRKNLAHWAAFIKKLEARESPSLTKDELDDIVGRKAQCTVWVRELRNAQKNGLSGGVKIPGVISANSGIATKASAGVSAKADA